MSGIVDPPVPVPLATDAGVHTPDAPVPAPERLSPLLVIALMLSQLGVAIPAVGMFVVSFPLTVAAFDPAGKANALSLLTGLYALVAIFVSPIAGILSDRCTSRLGMRRPFLLIGGAVSVGAMLLMGLATGYSALLLGALLYSIGAGIYTGGAAALVPDQVPERHRGKVMGALQVMTGIGGVIASIILPAFIGNQFAVFAIPSLATAVGMIFVVLVIKDRRISRDELDGSASVRGLLSHFRVNPRKTPDYAWAWLGKAITTLGTVLLTVYGIYFLTDQLQIAPDNLGPAITLVSLVGLATSILGAIIGSWISDRFRIRKNMVLWTSTLILIGSVVAAFAPDLTVYIIGSVIFGLGMGAYFPVDGALMIDVLPGEGKESGKYMGLMTLADQVPRSVGPFLAAGVLAIGGAVPFIGAYPLVFIVGGLVAVVGGLLVRLIKGSH